MKPLTEQMGMYAAYHRTKGNKVMHFIGIPTIVWSLMLALALPGGVLVSNLEVTLAHVVVAALLIYYLRLDFGLGIASVVVFTILLVSALQVAATYSVFQASMIALAVFVAGWVFQLVGHGVWEKRRPALVDNIWQVLVAPIFLVAEVAFGLGMKKDLLAAVEAEVPKYAEA